MRRIIKNNTYNVAQRGHIAESVRVVARRSAAPPRYRMAPSRQVVSASSRDHDTRATLPRPAPRRPRVRSTYRHQQSDCRQAHRSQLTIRERHRPKPTLTRPLIMYEKFVGTRSHIVALQER